MKKINLALQGGGAYGAFTWGVLDRLLEEPIEIEGISGTSAGAINAAALAGGLIRGGREGGRAAMDRFWRTLGRSSGALNPYHYWSEVLGHTILDSSPLSVGADMMSLLFSPYQLNPLNFDPLKDIIRKTVDLEILRKNQDIKIYISATNVETNRIKIFNNNDLCEEALLASATLPTYHQAVKWQGEHYWDGGFMGNPILEPLINRCSTKDIFIVQINPNFKKGYPFTAEDIQERLNEIVFNSSLMREIRSILNIQRLTKDNKQENPYTHLRLHSIHREEHMPRTGTKAKYNTSWIHLKRLKDYGRKAMEVWLKENYKSIGQTSTMDIGHWKM